MTATGLLQMVLHNPLYGDTPDNGGGIAAQPVVGTEAAPAKHQTRPSLLPRVAFDLLRLVDGVTIFGAGMAIHVVYVGGALAIPETWPRYALVCLVAALLVVMVLSHGGAYGRRARTTGALSTAVIGWTVVAVLLLGAGFVLKLSADFSRAWAINWFLVGLLYFAVSRLWLARLAGRWVRLEPCAIVGTPALCRQMANQFGGGPDAPFRIVAVHEVGVHEVDGQADTGRGAHRGLDDFMAAARDGHVGRVLLALPWNRPAQIDALATRLRTLPARIQLCPDRGLLDNAPVRTEVVNGVTLLTLRERPLSDRQQLLKRAEDIILAVVFLAVLGPIMGLIAVMVRLDSPGPVLFRQQRYQLGGNVFHIYKFRTLRHGTQDKAGLHAVTRDDVRTTRIGRWLRRTSLDELPQLFNVWRGEMSMVGPRPHPLGSAVDGVPFALAVDDYFMRYRVKPGLTGLAQINGLRGETTSRQELRARLDRDLAYIADWSLWLDIRILLMTAVRMFTDAKAY